MTSAYSDILTRIEAAIEAAQTVFARFTAGAIETEYKIGHDPVTEADRAVDAVLRQNLLRDGEGWLSEESVDDVSRLSKSRVWVVDPLDGTREFVQGIPEFCVSIGFVEDGRPVAGGICNPATNEVIIGAIDTGVFQNGDCQIRPMGSVAYKLGLVSAGLADVTFTLTPKNEWDVAAGAALVVSSGGFVATLENTTFRANNRQPLMSGLIAGGAFLREELLAAVQTHLPTTSSPR